jgi:hypothetical protein
MTVITKQAVGLVSLHPPTTRSIQPQIEVRICPLPAARSILAFPHRGHSPGPYSETGAMTLPEYIEPIMAVGGPVALVVIVLRFGPDAVVRLVAGLAAVLTKDKDRGDRCLKVLRILRGKDDDPPPSLPDSP